MVRPWVLVATGLVASCGPDRQPKVLTPVTLVTVVAANDVDRSALFQFSDELLAGSWWPAVSAEYGISTAASNRRVTGPPMAGALSRAQLLDYLEQATSAEPAADGHSLYLLYIPDGIQVTDTAFEAFHLPFPSPQTTRGDAWAVVTRAKPYPGGETGLQAATRLASHEVVEAATNPTGDGVSLGQTPAQPWSQGIWTSYKPDGEVEVGDLCEGTRISIAGAKASWEYQRSWSALAAARGGDPCVPQRPEPYFNVSASQDWFPVTPGATTAIALTGSATGPRADWLLNAAVVNGSGALGGSSAALTFSSELGELQSGPGCRPYPRTHLGATARLQVQVPPTAQKGDWAVISVCSFEEDPSTCYPPVDQDVCHATLVGVYVP